MAGTLQLARIGAVLELDPMGFQLRGQESGRTLQIVGEIAPADADEAKSIRNELWRMSENRDLVVPLAYTQDSSLDGLYRLLSADVSIEMVSLSGWYPFRASLKPYGAAGRAAVESRIIGGLRANDHSITAGTSEPYHAVPSTAIAYDPGATIPTRMTRTFDGVTMHVYRDVDNTVSPIWSIPPANFYDGAARAEVGTTLRVLSGLDSENLPTAWLMSNDGVRVKLTTSIPTGMLSVEHYDGSQWETAKIWKVVAAGSTVNTWHALSILRNDAAAVSIRLTHNRASGGAITLDLTLRRGSRFLEGRISNPAASSSFEVSRGDTTEAATAITGGARATATDGDGNRYVVGSTKTVTLAATGGIHRGTSSTTWDFFIGSEIGATGAASGDAAADLINQYHGYITETLNPVRR